MYPVSLRRTFRRANCSR